MQIPNRDHERELFYNDLIIKCLASKEERSRHYSALRSYYLFGGSADDEESPYNQVYPHIDLLTSFLFSADTTKFVIHLGAEVNPDESTKIPVLARSVNDDWLASNADAVVEQCISWALVYNTMLCKLVPKNGELHPFPVEPQCFGVLREDIPMLDRQEAMVMTYYTTMSQLRIDLADHPNRKTILENMSSQKRELNYEQSGLDRIIILNTQPNIQGNVNIDLTDRNRFIPKVDEDLIEMQELWVYDDEINDYRTITRADNRMTIYDRPNIFLKDEVPFIKFCTSPLPTYFWGSSEVDRLTGLQRWRNERIGQMRKLLNLQVNPPTTYNGMGIADEKVDAFMRDGGWLSMGGSPMDKVERFPPEMPADLFREIAMIDDMFAEQSGLQNLLQGKGETGVRSGKQTSELARLASARIKKRSLIVEKSLQKMATLYLKFKQVYDDTVYKDTNGLPFAASQFPKSYVVKVDGHSNSPLFVEDHKSLATELLEAHAIDRARFVQMLDPPSMENILLELKEIEKKEAEAAKQKHDEEVAAAQAKAQGGASGQLKQVK
jgi:hypothetical protein